MNTFIFSLLPVAIALVIAYWETFTWIFRTWQTYQGSHGPIILAVSCYMIWTQRETLSNLHVRPNLPWGVVVTLTGCLLLIAGKLGSLLLLQYLSLIITLLGVIWLTGGTSSLKALWLPVSYLIFMFPLFSELLAGFSLQLQMAAAWIAHYILKIMGVAVLRSGHFLELPTITLEVARECNGINHIMALVSLAVPLAYWTQTRWHKRILLVISAFFIGILANGIRVSIIGIWAVYHPGTSAHGPYDFFYVSFIFFFGMILLVVTSSLLREKDRDKTSPSAVQFVAARNKTVKSSPKMAIILATALLVLTSFYMPIFRPKPIYPSQQLTELPHTIGNWTGQEATLTETPFQYFKADIELKRIYQDPSGRKLLLYIGYFADQDQEREVVNYRFDPLQRNAVPVSIAVGVDTIIIKHTVLNKHEIPEKSIYFWYDLNGEIISERYYAKLATIFDAFYRQRTNAAIVVISVQDRLKEVQNDSPVMEFIKIALPLIRTSLTGRQ